VSSRSELILCAQWMDHLMPVYVAAGAASDEQGKRTWTLHEGSMGWSQYRFGSVTE
jgi:4,5-DOPA dioxygenase extradiol